jgi:prolyl-tRNA synthetase
VLHEGAYDRIMRRAGLRFYKVESDVGMMGGSEAHEYMAPSEAGEDHIVLCDRCDYAANVEKAVSVPRPFDAPTGPLEEIATPGVTTIEGLAKFLGVDTAATVKSVIVVPEDEEGGIVLALVRGDHRLHELKLAKVLGTTFRPAQPEEIRTAFGADPGSIGAVGLREGAVRDVVVDEVVTHGGYVAGANRTDHHLLHAQFGRDYTGVIADIRHAEAGETCVQCGGLLRIEPAIEVGNIFKLGTRYSLAFEATYLDEEGSEQPVVMGSYGIGPARILAAAVEQFADDQGIVWPPAIAPYDVWIVPIGPDALEAAGRLEADLEGRGLDVMVDDRDVSPGIRFADADLIGVPLRVTVGKKLADGVVELRRRSTGEVVELPVTEAGDLLARAVAEAKWS